MVVKPEGRPPLNPSVAFFTIQVLTPQGVMLSVEATGGPQKFRSINSARLISAAMRFIWMKFTIRLGSRFMSITWPMIE